MAKTTRSDIFEQVKGILKDQLGLSTETLKNVTRLTNICQDLAADDLDGVEIIMSFEEQFGICIPEEDMLKWGMSLEEDGRNFTVGNCVDYICQRLGIK